MYTSKCFTDHTLTCVLARQRAAQERRSYAAQINRMRAQASDNPQALVPFLRALGSSGRVAQRATALLYALGADGGSALATLLPAAFAVAETQPPHTAATLRHNDTMLCAAVALVEQLAPEYIADVYLAVARQRRALGYVPWWTFRPWQRLNAALHEQSILVAGA